MIFSKKPSGRAVAFVDDGASFRVRRARQLRGNAFKRWLDQQSVASAFAAPFIFAIVAIIAIVVVVTLCSLLFGFPT